LLRACGMHATTDSTLFSILSILSILSKTTTTPAYQSVNPSIRQSNNSQSCQKLLLALHVLKVFVHFKTELQSMRYPDTFRQPVAGNKFSQIALDWNDKNTIHHNLLFSAIQQYTCGLGIIHAKKFQPLQIGTGYPVRMLDFYCRKVGWRIDDKIDLRSVRCPPVAQSVFIPRVVAVRAKVLIHQALQRLPADVGLRIKPSNRTKLPEHARIEIIKLLLSKSTT